MEEEKEIVENWPWFYKIDNESLLFAPNYVINKNYTLRIEDKDSSEYPVDWWSFLASTVIANAFFWIDTETVL